ncbi:HupE/UreJ family protein [Cucumibacter marinus]|uniref:HupE/UreJ family protein n=1 Tax=Cucumibacter marinus TaxID=1121252 RepID=UPI000413DA54|nr:HupE/UreJ family protein [Cucumibacter marinus]
MRKLILTAATAAAVLLPAAAFAHAGGHTPADGFWHGFAHPIGGLDHILAMLGVGFLAYVMGGRALYLVPLSFVGMMVAGFGLGLVGFEMPFLEFGILASVIVIGTLGALGRPIPLGAAMATVGAFALFHGVAHGAEMPVATSGLTYGLGFAAATALLHAAGLGLGFAGSAAASRMGRTLARIGAGVTALVGLGLAAGLA